MLGITLLVTGWCWQTQNANGLSNTQLRDICLDIWFLASALLGLSQLAFAGMSVWKKHYLVLACSSAILLGISVWLYALSRMPS